jgi:hypothetical protein
MLKARLEPMHPRCRLVSANVAKVFHRQRK